jgi:predicted dehydrogenase
MILSRRGFAQLASALAVNAKPIRAAMVGTGHGHAGSKYKALSSMPEYEFLGVARPDPHDPAAHPAFANVSYLDAAQLLADPNIEMIACEFADPDTNLDYALRAVAAGKHVHIDKPPGASLPRFRQLLAEAARKSLAVQMGYQWRYHPAMQAVLEAARNGWLGRVYRFRASIDKPIGAEERHHLAKYKGGMMFSEGCHLIDRATVLLGKPSKVTGFIRHHAHAAADRLADNNLVILEYPNAFAEISLAGFDPHGNQHRYVEVLGTNGFAKASPFAPARLHVELKEAAGPYKSGLQTLVPPDPPGLPYTPDFRQLAAVIRRGEKPDYSPAHDLMTHEVLLAACEML